MADRRHTLGQAAEAAAAEFLARAGLRVVERNVRFALGELDLVCRDGDTVVFVEVKCRQARWGDDSGGGRLLARSGGDSSSSPQLYLKARGLAEVRCRFDVVAVTEDGDGRRVVRHLPATPFEA